MKDRVGTDRDADSLTKLFMYLGFYTNRYDNLKGKEMRGTLQVSMEAYYLNKSSDSITSFQTVGGLDHSNYDCLLVAILSHGVNGKLYSTDGDLIPVEKITE